MKLKTKNVFIDTEAFDAASLNFESTPFIELVRLVEADFVKVFISVAHKVGIAVAHMGIKFGF